MPRQIIIIILPSLRTLFSSPVSSMEKKLKIVITIFLYEEKRKEKFKNYSFTRYIQNNHIMYKPPSFSQVYLISTYLFVSSSRSEKLEKRLKIIGHEILFVCEYIKMYHTSCMYHVHSTYNPRSLPDFAVHSGGKDFYTLYIKKKKYKKTDLCSCTTTFVDKIKMPKKKKGKERKGRIKNWRLWNKTPRSTLTLQCKKPFFLSLHRPQNRNSSHVLCAIVKHSRAHSGDYYWTNSIYYFIIKENLV